MKAEGIHCFIENNEIKYQIITDNGSKIIADIEDIKDLQINSIK